ncbi:MAG: DUF6320 domain-containing protein [Lachnospiraceae bacterium]|nr:DUF6320 domain-containing protein [Lachnospiraceae bacterium]
MQYCEKCGISVRGNKTCCPLCGGVLSGTPEEHAFPAMPKRALSGKSVVKISFWIFIAFEAAIVTARMISSQAMRKPLPWVPIVMLCAAIAWIDIALAFYLRNNVLKVLTFEGCIVMLLEFFLDRSTGAIGWSLDWMIPLTFLGLGTATIAVAAYARMRLGDFGIYLLADAALSLLQLIPLLTGQNHFPPAAIACMAIYLVIVAVSFLFRWRDMKNAAEKYFRM